MLRPSGILVASSLSTIANHSSLWLLLLVVFWLHCLVNAFWANALKSLIQFCDLVFAQSHYFLKSHELLIFILHCHHQFVVVFLRKQLVQNYVVHRVFISLHNYLSKGCYLHHILHNPTFFWWFRCFGNSTYFERS